MAFTIAQITDTHLVPYSGSHLYGFPTDRSLAAVLAEVKRLAPDYLLFTGDLADAGEYSAYEKLVELVTPLNIPSVWIGGNHDLIDRLEVTLSQPPFDPRKSLELGGWRIILLSSVITDKCTAQGELGTQALEWLKSELQTYSDQPTLIALHHHPVPSGLEKMDALGLQSPENFFKAIAPFDQVRLVVFGHIHHDLHHIQDQVNYYGCPSTCVQFINPNLETAENPELKLPGFRLLSLFLDGTFETQIHRIKFTS
ncbi:putative phosphohydrolase [Synechococcus sp. PCC 7502]|uniref:phosphodiesterase n=1 Tax=Synechococcus sp. PCC 7502 TaxID=1173263 RepID=UPI00029F9B3E|nr:phosphodiesterase [Synechococcus sp. PCC 7502]AFY73347.1 putative phosphohydrolase [Synechococcus sp. PCC 7502]